MLSFVRLVRLGTLRVSRCASFVREVSSRDVCTEGQHGPSPSPGLVPVSARTITSSRSVLDPGGEVMIAARHPPRAPGWTGCVGGCVAAVGALTSGSAAALPAGVALTYLAWSDLISRRLSLRLLAGATVVVSTSIAAEAINGGSAKRLGPAAVAVLVLLIAATTAWMATRGIAFGDVLLLGFAALVPAWLSAAAVVTMVGVAIVVAGIGVAARRLRPDLTARPSVAFAPALLVGWVVGVAIG